MKLAAGRCLFAKRPNWPWAGWVEDVTERIWTFCEGPSEALTISAFSGFECKALNVAFAKFVE
jgi:hypothetical protein